jgi:hypothetical protein
MIKFFVENGVVYGLNHQARFGQRLVLPIRECNQFNQCQDIMLSAESDLKGRIDGVWIWNPELRWQHSKMNKTDKQLFNSVNLGGV